MPLLARAAERLVISINYAISNYLTDIFITLFLLLVGTYFFYTDWEEVLLTAASRGIYNLLSKL